MNKTLARSQFLALASTAVLVGLSLAASQVGLHELLVPLLLLTAASGLLALGCGLYREKGKNRRAVQAGFLGCAAGVGMPAWVVGSTLGVFPEGVRQACIQAAGYDKVSADMTLIRSYFPPGLYCFPDGYGLPIVLASSPSSVIASSIALTAIISAVVVAISLLVARPASIFHVR